MNALLLAAPAAALAGFLALSLAMDRHHEAVFATAPLPPARRRWLRLAGAAQLGVALGACLAARGTAQGWVLWFGVLTLAALGAVLAHTYASRRAPQLAWAAAAMQLAAVTAAAPSPS